MDIPIRLAAAAGPSGRSGAADGGVSHPLDLSARHFLLLSQWLSPAFPVGAFAYSHGLERAIRSGDVAGRDDLLDWLVSLLEFGSARNDAIFLVHAWGAESERELAEIAALAQAFSSSAERHRETMEMGRALAGTLNGTGWEEFSGTGLEFMAYPVVLGVAARVRGIPLGACVLAFLQAFCANLVSAAQRLVPLGQTEAQDILSRLHGPLENQARKMIDAPLEALGGCAFGSDMAAMEHETQTVRLFRT